MTTKKRTKAKPKINWKRIWERADPCFEVCFARRALIERHVNAQLRQEPAK